MSPPSGSVVGAPIAGGRFAGIRQRIVPGTRGIEIGPFRNPVAAKRDGYDTLVVDRYDQESLRRLSRQRGVPEDQVDLIEAVDFVGDASRLLDLVRGGGFDGRVSWIVSSHNFEHLPDPLRFLRDCEQLLEPDGLLMMIVPDKRFCMDRFQPAATLAGIVRAAGGIAGADSEAWAAFSQRALAANLILDGRPQTAWSLDDDAPQRLRLRDPIQPHANLNWALARGVDPGFAGHRWRFTPSVLEAILFDLGVLGLTGFTVDEVTPTVGYEFTLRLRVASATPRTMSTEEIQERRTELYRRAEDEMAVVSRAYRQVADELREARAELARRDP